MRIKLIIFLVTFLASVILVISLFLRLLTKKLWRKKYWYGILVGTIVTSGYLYYDFYGRDLKSPQVVDVNPIYELNLNSDVSSLYELFKEYKISGTWTKPNDEKLNPDGIKEYLWYEDKVNYSTVSVCLELYYNQDKAKKSFDLNSTFYDDEMELDKLTFGGQDNNRYWISYVEQQRNDPGGFRFPMDEYTSYVVFQKGNLVICISEITNQKKSTRTSEVIKIIADKLKGL